MPVRVQLSRRKGWRLPPDTVSVARPGKWGNPWVVWCDAGQWLVTHNGREHHKVSSKAMGISWAVAKYRTMWLEHIEWYGVSSTLLELRGKNLACWCHLDQPCHADVLLELANKPL